jgi:flavin reductase (DIM6/NTAB) family NADH-FMN oxidoreductase RutF
MPCSLVGAKISGKPNYLTVAWFTMVNPKPPYVLVSLNKAHYTDAGVKENQTFSVNIPSAEIADRTDYCGLVSGHRFDKSAVFPPDQLPGRHGIYCFCHFLGRTKTNCRL